MLEYKYFKTTKSASNGQFSKYISTHLSEYNNSVPENENAGIFSEIYKTEFVEAAENVQHFRKMFNIFSLQIINCLFSYPNMPVLSQRTNMMWDA